VKVYCEMGERGLRGYVLPIGEHLFDGPTNGVSDCALDTRATALASDDLVDVIRGNRGIELTRDSAHRHPLSEELDLAIQWV
jgi:hypothetical protein